MNPTELAGIIGAVGVAMGAIAAFYKLRPDRDVLLITQAQGASTILNDLVETLREEVERERKRVQQLEKENRLLTEENEGLRRRFGTRSRDD